MLAYEARRLIRASGEHVFAHLAQPEHLPRYAAPLWMTADAVEKRGNTHVLALHGYFIGLPVESVQRIVLRAPAAVDFTQTRGTLRAFSARCTFESVEDGTEVLFRVEADPGIAMISEDAARQFLVQYVERMLDRIKLAAERKAPVRRAPRGTATSSALPGAGRPTDQGDEATDETDAVPALPHRVTRAEEVLAIEGEVAAPGASAASRSAAAQAAADPGKSLPRSGGQGTRPGAGALSGRRRRRRRRRSGRGTGGGSGDGGTPHPGTPMG